MGLMQKLRSSTKYIIWILILSFGLLWVLADTQVFDAMMAGPRNMGEVDGVPISWAEFNQRVNLHTERHRQQHGASPQSEIRAQIEESAWEELVYDKILKKKMEEMGIIVTDSELLDMVVGEDPDPFIRQQFTREEDGTLDRVALQNAIEAPENREVWIMIEQQLREQRRQQKLFQYLEASLKPGNFEIEQHYKRQNSRVDFRYVRVPYSEVSDDEISIEEADIRSYYRNNQDRFHRNKSWRFSYVTFDLHPTKEDTARTVEWIQNLREEFKQTDNVRRFLELNYSETDYMERFLSPQEVRREHLRAFTLQPGEVSEPYIHEGRVHMVKLLESRPIGEEFVWIRQIRLNDDDEGEERAQNLVQRYRQGESFKELARTYSTHNPSARRGGDLGYLERADKSESISNAIFNARTGTVIGPLKDGNHLFLFKIMDKTSQEIRYADMSRDIEPDPMQTIQRLANDAEDFQYFSRSDGFIREAERSEYTVQEGFATQGNPFIAGLGQSRVILNELPFLRRGEVSDVIETEERFLVLKVDEIIPEGPRPLDDVRSEVESLVMEEKRKEFLTQKMNETLAGITSLEEAAEILDKSIQNARRVRLNQPSIPGAGREPKISGAAFALEKETLSPPIAGTNALFLLVVEGKTVADPAEMTEREREQIYEQLLQRKNTAFGRVWADRLKEEANIRDFRTQQRLLAPAPM